MDKREDPGSGINHPGSIILLVTSLRLIRDPGSWMDKREDPGSGINHPGSITLLVTSLRLDPETV